MGCCLPSRLVNQCCCLAVNAYFDPYASLHLRLLSKKLTRKLCPASDVPHLPCTGAFFSFFTTPVTRIGGRKLVMILGGGAFCVGAILCAFAQDLAMLIIGRVCLGAGVGFANQV